MSKIKAAIIGTGGISWAHMVAHKQNPGRTEVLAAVDVDQKRVNDFALKHHIPGTYTDVAKMLAEVEPDIVHICTPPSTHASLAIQAMEAGAWVLCEKPMCGSLEEFDRISEAEKRTGNYCSSVFQWRYGSSSRHLKKLFSNGKLGRALVGICQTTWYRSHSYYDVPWRGRWDAELGGPTMGHGIHSMDHFLYILGEWSEISAQIATLDRRIEVEDVSMAIVKMENGCMASIINSVLSPREESYLRLDFQKATVELRHVYSHKNRDWTIHAAPLGHDVQTEIAHEWDALTEDQCSSHGTQLKEVLDCLERNQRPLVSGAEARRTIEFISCLYKAASTGTVIKRGDVKPGDPFYHCIGGSFAMAKKERGHSQGHAHGTNGHGTNGATVAAAQPTAVVSPSPAPAAAAAEAAR
ncbi:MAG: Gfo/Idh/MocA family protein [Candidatus Methylacidiphilales bacterium]|nr:Gfo/Idh/MocA family oxidoreductase [Candidatus Methylacidiphilales bacterium]